MNEIDLSQFDANEVLQTEFVDEYDAGMKYFFSELVELNTILFIVAKIIEFPFDTFSSPHGNIFFTMVMKCFYNHVILQLSKLVTDTSSDFYSLRQFKNNIRQAVRPEYCDKFDKLLREMQFNQKFSEFDELIRDLRNNVIAHVSKDYLFEGKKFKRPNIKQIKNLRDILNQLLDVLSFNVDRLMLPIPYSKRIQRQNKITEKTDIDEILDCIAKNSVILNLPEKNPTSWNYTKNGLSPSVLQQINEYRRKFGLPDV